MRLCLSAVRIVAWNTANRPDNVTEDARFRTVFEAIGNETSAGNTLPPSIIALQETDNFQFGNDSAARIEAILESLYPTQNYQHSTSSLDSGGDANGFVYDEDLFDLVSTSVVDETPGMQNFAHNIYRGQFRPEGTNGDSDFYIYSTHLKAGSDGSNENRRTAEANAIRVDMDALGDGVDILVMGDFNIGGSSEGAYQNFLAPGNGQLFDPIDSPGEWKNDSRYRSIHTQNPEINGPGGMDDRYDFQLATAEVFDDEGLQYIDGSYRAFGNNGTHSLDDDITSGTGAAANVLLALAQASDHLPVVVDYNIDSVASAGFNVTPTGNSIAVSEAGATDTYSVVLNTVPSSDVTIDIVADAQTLIDGQATASLVFTPATALTPQSIAVSAVDDATAEGTHISVLTHTASSSDTDYSSLSPQNISVTVTDNDIPTVVISELMYNPNSSENDGFGEWIELANLGPGSVDVSGWTIDDEDSLDWAPIPSGTPSLPPGGVIVVHNDQIESSVFRDRWSVPADAEVVGVSWGSLSNGPNPTSEIIVLADAQGIQQDQVNYDDENGWPADGGGESIYLIDPLSDNDVGSSWNLSAAGQNGATNPSGSPFATTDVGSPGRAPVNRPPTDVELVTDMVVENIDTSSAAFLVSSFSVTDADATDTHTLQLVAGTGDQDNAAFEITGDALFFKQNQTVDFEQKSIYQIRVEAVDPDGATVQRALTVTIANVPELAGLQIDANSLGEPQRSSVRSATLIFDQVVTATNDAFELFKSSAGDVSIPLSASLQTVGDRTHATLTFSGPHVEPSSLATLGGSLSDGNYRLVINADQVSASGNAQPMTSDATEEFFRLFGDTDGDRDVDTTDFGAFRQVFGTSTAGSALAASLDQDTDGDVDGIDLASLRRRVFSRLPAP